MIVELKVEVLEYWPQTSRVIRLERERTFEELHEVLQLAFEWESGHPYEFGILKDDGETESLVIRPEDAARWKVRDWLWGEGDAAVYRVKTGTGWEHRIEVAGVWDFELNRVYPSCCSAEGELPEVLTVPPAFVETGVRAPDELSLDINQSLIKFIGIPELEGPGFWAGSYREDRPMDSEEEAVFEREFTRLRKWIRRETSRAIRLMKEVYDKRPWELLDDNQIFGIELEGKREPLFVQVLGSEGDDFGLVVYNGWDGYRFLRRKQAGTLTKEEELYGMTGVYADFKNRKEVFAPERQMLRGLGFTFKEGGWPVLRSVEPGYVENPPMPIELDWLQQALKALLALIKPEAARFSFPRLGEDEGMIIFRAVQAGQMEGELMSEPAVPPAREPGLRVHDYELRHVKELPKSGRIVEFDVSYWPSPVREKSWPRMYHPLAVFAADAQTGEVIAANLLSRPAPDVLAQPLFNELLICGKMEIPAEVRVNEATARRIRPLAKELGIRLTITEDLPAVQAAKEAYKESLPHPARP
ncbi:DUF6930 domain-containing protein [Bhargavaea ullalensis]|uniref:Uncharacterized protein n=1 Tax=Bhargavaea ullalensis TaxID=1265685 RepID=A0ABV2G9N0_9BACL